MILEDIWLVVGNMNGLWLSRNSWEWNGKIIPTVTHSIIFQRGRAKNHQADTHIHLYTLCIYNVHLMVNGYYLPIYHIIDKPYDSRSLTIYISIYLPYINHHFLMGGSWSFGDSREIRRRHALAKPRRCVLEDHGFHGSLMYINITLW